MRRPDDVQPAPPRLSLGPLFAAACASWAVVVLVEGATWAVHAGHLDVLRPIVCAACLAALAVLVVVFIARKRRPRAVAAVCAALAVPLAACACTGLCAWLHWSAWEGDVAMLAQLARSGGFDAEVTGDAAQKDYGVVSTARVKAGRRWVRVRITWLREVEPPGMGRAVHVDGSVRVPADDDAGRWNHRNGYAGMLSARSWRDAGPASGLLGEVSGFREASFERIEELGGEAAALLAGVLLGNRTLYAGSELEQDFRACGLAHLMAVSGTHLAVVTALLGWAASRARLKRAVRVPVICTVLVLYTFLTGLSPSAVRSCIMCAACFAAGLARRRRDSASALSLCIVCILATSPESAFSASLQLSALAVCGIVVFAPLASAWLAAALPGFAQALCDPLAVTAAATFATTPVSIALFVQLPLIAPAATVVAAPLVTVALGAGVCALALCAVCAPAGQLLLQFAGAVANACAAAVHAMADVPGACMPLDAASPLIAVCAAAAAVALWVFWPDPARLDARLVRGVAAACIGAPVVAMALAGSGAAVTAPPLATSAARVVMLDVGQGDAMLVQDAKGALLVDTGEDGAVLKRCLARNGITRLDAVVITHKDADHCGALPSLAGVVVVDHVYIHEGLLDYDGEADVLRAARWVTAGRGAEGVRPGRACASAGSRSPCSRPKTRAPAPTRTAW